MQLAQFTPGMELSFDAVTLTEQEVIAFALLVDPQPVHTDVGYARTTRFGGIIASGMHAYTVFHKKYWIPLCADTFICGVSIEGMHFYLPLYPDTPVGAKLIVLSVVPQSEKGSQLVQWRWEFYIQDQLMQDVVFTTLHTLVPIAVLTQKL